MMGRRLLLTRETLRGENEEPLCGNPDGNRGVTRRFPADSNFLCRLKDAIITEKTTEEMKIDP
jgi:hypothetical protein